MSAALEDAKLFAAIEGGGGDDFEQVRFGHVVRAGASDERSAGSEES